MRDLTQGRESRLILMFAVPMLLGNVFQQMYNVVDSIIVGKLIGKGALAAVGASFPVNFIMISLVLGIASGASVIISQYFGAKKYDEVRKAIDTMYIVLFAASFVVSITGILLSEYIFRAMRLPEEILPDAVLFFRIIMIGVFGTFGFQGTAAVLRGLGDSKTPLYFLIVSTVANMILVVVFVKYFKWGIAGSAIATVIAEMGAFLTGIWYLNRTSKMVKISLRNITFDREMFRKSLRIGLPSGLQMMIVSLGMATLFGIVNGFGTDVSAAYSAAARVDAFALMPAMNFSMALAVFVGQNMGAGKVERVISGFKTSLLITSGISLFFSIVAIIGGTFLMKMFTTDANVIEVGHHYLIITGSFYVLFSAMFMFNGVFRGAGDTLTPMFITLIALWVARVPTSYFMSKQFGTEGIWWGIPVGWVVGLGLCIAYYYSGRWKTKTVVRAVPNKE